MSAIASNSSVRSIDNSCFYLPHHPVFKEFSETTKLRVVFNGSSLTTSGVSLNDVLKTGPKVQNDLFDIVLRMRTYPVVLIADIEKMYRMILVHESDRSYQRILWRKDPNSDIQHYELNTVVYGLSSSSFLATRVLNEVGLRCQNDNPKISEIIINDFYMDDLITGSKDAQSAIEIKNDISNILQESGFKLRKWLSNKIEVLSQISENLDPFTIKSEKEIKTLGILWEHREDIFCYSFKINFDHSNITKRTVLSGVAQLYDPLGLINPIIVQAKLILQNIWKHKIDWDDELPAPIREDWREFINNSVFINQIKIARCVLESGYSENNIYLHGFCDSSQKVYGAAIYLTYIDKHGQIQANLICAKSRLAPLNTTLTIPKLELSGAYLLAQLMEKVKLALRVPILRSVYWTDSTIVLAWLNKDPSHWRVFVCNRVAEIHRLSENSEWRHVATDENPADILSRGSTPQDLKDNLLWWHGPRFIREAPENWPKIVITDIEIVPEARKEDITLSYTNAEETNWLFARYSSYTKLLRVTAYILRFIWNCRSKKCKQQKETSQTLSLKEINNAEIKLCFLVQREVFSEEIKCLKQNKPIPKGSCLKKLNPMLNPDDQLCRLDGRLKHANIPFEQKYPIILPSRHSFTILLIRHYHLKYLHGGTQVVLSQIRTKFWPLKGRSLVRSVLHKCVTCFRIKPVDINQLMGSLPQARVIPSRPFSICGVDFAGPYSIRDGKTRSRVTLKAYLSIFICFSTRAVHVELVTDLTTEAFLNAFKRFVSRRGLCSHIYSDNATNFVGSCNELNKLSSLAKECANSTYQTYFSDNKITWHFIPPRSPHCGGLWEAAVKSFKYHIKRVIGETRLDFENFYTVLTQIEAILNSRPILPLTDDPTDLQVLTPAHFLTGSSLVACPQDEVTDINVNRLKYFKQLQHIVQHFWQVWSTDYLHSLQQRSKWSSKQPNIKINQMVLLKTDNEPPMRWPLGRVVMLHPGDDNLVRVVSIRTPNGVFKRAITKICPLPEFPANDDP